MKITSVTPVRTNETLLKYLKYIASNPSNNPFEDAEKRAIKNFNYWVIVENDFPYDAIAKDHHLLVTKRVVPCEFRLLNKDEIEEFYYIKENYIKENYEVLWENMPKGQSVNEHFHVHLLNLKREPITSPSLE